MLFVETEMKRESKYASKLNSGHFIFDQCVIWNDEHFLRFKTVSIDNEVKTWILLIREKNLLIFPAIEFESSQLFVDTWTNAFDLRFHIPLPSSYSSN